jgi:hypothetical protein
MTEKRQTSQGYIIRILQHFATKLRNITNFVMLFQAVVKLLSRLVYTAKNDQVVAMLMKTRLNNALLPTLFTVVNNIEQYCYTRFRLNNIVRYCWQMWTTWAAKHCSILLSSGLGVFLPCRSKFCSLGNRSNEWNAQSRGRLYNKVIKVIPQFCIAHFYCAHLITYNFIHYT